MSTERIVKCDSGLITFCFGAFVDAYSIYGNYKNHRISALCRHGDIVLYLI